MWLFELLFELIVGAAEWSDHRSERTRRPLPGRTLARSILAGGAVAVSVLCGFAWGVASWGGGVGDGVPVILPISVVGATLLFAAAGASRGHERSTFGQPPPAERRRRTLGYAVAGVLVAGFAVGVALGMTRV